jgi:hypothetical protein
MKNLHTRLARLERQSPATKNIKEMSDQELTKHIKEMSDQELLRLAGLPPDASDEDIDAVAKSFEQDMAGTARKEGPTRHDPRTH